MFFPWSVSVRGTNQKVTYELSLNFLEGITLAQKSW